MNWYNYLIIIVITVILAVVVVRWIPGLVIPAGGAYQSWLYIDKIEGLVQMTDIAGNTLNKDIVTYKGDELIFVNRTDTKVLVGFPSVDIFGAAQRSFEIEPLKRARKKVIGVPNQYSFTLGGSGPTTPPKVKIGEEP